MRCAMCGMEPAAVLPLRKNYGMVVSRYKVTIDAPLCRDHGRKKAARFLFTTLVTGWWGTISLVVNIGYVATDISSWNGYRRLGAPQPPIVAAQQRRATMLPPVDGTHLTAAQLIHRPETRVLLSQQGAWKDDPYRRYRERYFDGSRWTDHVRTDGVEATDPPAWRTV